ncbi:CDP-glycerol glycerophosphotransferase family protein [Aequorivita sp. CIP111184]|uniref:CDP-glycerol glycerophosphotransferase family protein n=1 Tax=Aequorivita sp. CIP111184 TaxID=2211356 RepID=UPI000DBBDEE8|nr:CDP-glycerol glycerophosphotransferase family protein [Aequorivita sp. CIP111184]SRX55306.1 hypothetical protein AEQU1_02328 [Aequorivita sp. CIP111184]
MKGNHKIAIIFLDEIHHIYHFTSIAVELSKNNEVHLLTHPGKQEFLYKTLKNLNGENVIVEKLQTSLFRAFTDKLKNRKLPRKGFWVKKHQNYILNNFDAVIFTDYFHHYLLEARGQRNKPKFIKVPHGLPGRGYSYNKELLDFDFQLLYGNFHVEQMEEKKLLSKNWAVAGFPKLDVIEKSNIEPIFSDEKTTVIYNPHFEPALSSWPLIGLEILEFFYNSKKYNLIFAPHINLFNKLGVDNNSTVPEKYFTAKNIHIDLGSEKSVNMAYVNEADIYLGDVSSQVFEFIINPRPCIFLNPKKVKFKGDINYRFWSCGKIIKKVGKLPKALKKAPKQFNKKYREIQQKMNSENFHIEEGSTASQLAATAITEYLDRSL